MGWIGGGGSGSGGSNTRSGGGGALATANQQMGGGGSPNGDTGAGGGEGLGSFGNMLIGGVNKYNQGAYVPDGTAYGYDTGQHDSYNGLGDQAQGRMGAQAGYGNADQDRMMGLGARGSQADALGLAQQAAMGNAPSVAQQQLLQGRDQSLQNAMAMANSVRGGGANLAAAQMGAMRQGGEQMGQVNQQSAMLRAQEMAAARAQYGGMAAQMRGQDMGLQGQDAQQSQFNAGLEQQQHGLNDAYQAGMYGLQQHASDQSQMGGIKQQEDTAANQLGAGQINSGIANQNAATTAAAGNQMMMMAAMLAASDERLKTNVTPIGLDTPGPVEQKEMGAGYGPPPAAAKASGGSGGGMSSMMSGMMGGGGEEGGGMMAAMSDARVKDNVQGVSEGTKARSPYAQMGGGFAPAMSDERVKNDVHGMGRNPVEQFLGSLNPVEYNYKAGVPGEDPSQKRYGILAQDVNKTPMGHSLVQETPIGMAINVPHATTALMAGEGELYARQKRLEAELARMHGGRR